MMGPMEMMFTAVFAMLVHETVLYGTGELVKLLISFELLPDLNGTTSTESGFAGGLFGGTSASAGSSSGDEVKLYVYYGRHALAVLVAIYFTLVAKPAKKIPRRAPSIKPEECVEYGDLARQKSSPGNAANNLLWTCDAEACLPTRFAKTGPASEAWNPAMTVPKYMAMAAQQYPDAIALRVERPVPAKLGEKKAPSLPLDEWTSWTYSQFHDEVNHAAAAMATDFDVKMFGSVAVWGFNAPEWHMSFAAAAAIGAKVAGIYPTDSLDHMCYKVKQSNASVAVVEGKKQCETLLQAPKNLLGTKLKAVVVYSVEDFEYVKSIADSAVCKTAGLKVITWPQLVAIGQGKGAAVLQERQAKLKPGHCCVLIYTSGTTGMPKGVMLSHDNLCSTACVGLYEHVYDSKKEFGLKHTTGTLKGPQRLISYLPLSHIAGLMLDVVFPIVATAKFSTPATVYFARKYDLSEATIVQRMESIRPTIFLGVPRVWEKLAEGMKAVGAKVKPPMKWLSQWAKMKCLIHSKNCLLGGNGQYPLKWGLANTVTGLVRKKIGLDKLQFAVTGAAPMNPETYEYWGSLGVTIFEVFAMSESTGLATTSSLRGTLWATVGFSAPGFEIKVFDTMSDATKKFQTPPAINVFQPTEKEQGELCYRGRNVMMGYLANPGFGAQHVAELQKKTAEAIDDEGWVRSGDKACVSASNMLRITGRYKELIITAGGENIAPVPIENWLQTNFPAISNVMMVGDKKKYNTCLISLKAVGATGLEPGTDQLTPDCVNLLNSSAKTISGAQKDPAVQKYLESALKAVNQESSVVPSNACKIQKFKILPCDFSVAGEELTPTMKLKRSFVMDKYRKLIDEMYGE
ncbi:unnamed protein product [Amoebophrya sp. A120]|nr:unnamed protein product [Amoebophrya sp. A120]|eukprot:GSA120T00016465001.1